MGINGLSNFLKSKYPTVFKDISMEDLRYKKIAVDTSLYIYKYKVINGELFYDCFIKLICCLRKFDVHPVFIFDTSAPVEKIEEQQRRRKAVQDRRDNIKLVEECVEKYHQEGVIEQELQEFYDKKIKRIKGEDDNNLLRKKLNLKPKEIKTFDIEFVEKEIEKINAQNISITPENISNLKKLFDLMGVQHYQALEEAEQTCSYLCYWKLCDGVLTEDSDVLAYGVDLFISKINSYNGCATLIETPNLLEKLEFTKQQLLDFCIMLQCDYNTRVPGVGPVNAFKILRQKGTLEDVENEGEMDITCLNYKRCRELFSPINDQGFFNIIHSTQPNYKELGQFLYDVKSQTNMSFIKKECGYNIIN